MKKIILVLNEFKDIHKRKIESISGEYEIRYRNSKSVTESDIEEAEVIIGNPKLKLLQKARNLKWLQLSSAGANGYTDKGILKQDCILTNVTGSYGLAISEHMIGMTLMLFKKFNLYYNNQRKHLWKSEGSIKSIYNSTFMIIGLGDIGNEFAKRVKALGGYTIGVKRNLSEKEDFIDELYRVDKLSEILHRVDVVTMSVPGNKETYNLMNEEKLKLLKKEAILTNVGRGTSLDLDALCSRLNQGLLAGASIDVTNPEPLGSDDIAWDTKNLIITPHISRNFYLEETFDRFVDIACSNLKAYLNGEELKNVVDLETEYRIFKG